MIPFEKDPLKIAISRGDKVGSYPKYNSWIQLINPEIELINLYGTTLEEAIALLKNSHALLLSGGNDIHPGFYNKEVQIGKCFDIDENRDLIEIALLHQALELNLPVLAICRGLQILNVALGGSLITDIASEYKDIVKHSQKGDLKDDCFHNISIADNSLLYRISGKKNEIVNSYHHQAIDVLSDQLKVTAYADDKIIEAIEWASEDAKSFLLGVQWHPERGNAINDFSLNIAETFINASTTYKSIY